MKYNAFQNGSRDSTLGKFVGVYLKTHWNTAQVQEGKASESHSLIISIDQWYL